MLNRKSWSILAACAAVAVGNVALADSSSASDFAISQPVALQAAPARKPLMWGLNEVGLAKPLEDWNINIGGYASASFTYYADPAAGKFNPGRSFDLEHEDPTINQIGAFVERTVDVTKNQFDVGGRLEFIYGGDARLIHGTGLFDHYGLGDGPDEQFDPVQAYLDFVVPVGAGLRVRVGKFVTPAGYETINPTTTPLYSRGLLFTYLLPFTHSGILGTYAPNDTWSFDFGAVRGWEDATEDKNDGVTAIGRVSYTFPNKKSALYVTGLYGPEFIDDSSDYRTLIDAVWTYKYSDQWSFAVQGDVLWEEDQNGLAGGRDEGFAAGLGGWATYTFSSYIQVNGRAEVLHDGDNLRFPTASAQSNNVYSAALGLTITPFPTDNVGSNLKIRPEVRYDYAQRSSFGGDNDQFTFALEGYFTF